MPKKKSGGATICFLHDISQYSVKLAPTSKGSFILFFAKAPEVPNSRHGLFIFESTINRKVMLSKLKRLFLNCSETTKNRKNKKKGKNPELTHPLCASMTGSEYGVP